jgi:hypothetical protein
MTEVDVCSGCPKLRRCVSMKVYSGEDRLLAIYSKCVKVERR